MEERRAADDGADLAHDRLRRFLEVDGVAEDFADGVEEVDLLVAAGQFLPDLDGAPLAVEQRAEHGAEPVRGGVGRRVGQRPRC